MTVASPSGEETVIDMFSQAMIKELLLLLLLLLVLPP